MNTILKENQSKEYYMNKLQEFLKYLDMDTNRWKKRNGEYILIKDMSISHLINTCKLIARQLDKSLEEVLLEEEFNKRKREMIQKVTPDIEY